MRLPRSTPGRIEAAFAAAVASGDYEAAEGWFAVARYVARREAPRRRALMDLVIRTRQDR